jgi:hypothetical protein
MIYSVNVATSYSNDILVEESILLEKETASLGTKSPTFR